MDDRWEFDVVRREFLNGGPGEIRKVTLDVEVVM